MPLRQNYDLPGICRRLPDVRLVAARQRFSWRGELVAIDIEDLMFAADGPRTALIRRWKTDHGGGDSGAPVA
jgi:hypothetical protein